MIFFYSLFMRIYIYIYIYMLISTYVVWGKEMRETNRNCSLKYGNSMQNYENRSNKRISLKVNDLYASKQKPIIATDLTVV